MEQYDTTNGNILIAKYDGLEYRDKDDRYLFTCKEWYKNGIGHYTTEQLEYHKSWDWIMPVILKISKERLLSFRFDIVTELDIPYSFELKKHYQFSLYMLGRNKDDRNEELENPFVSNMHAPTTDPIMAAFYTIEKYLEWRNENPDKDINIIRK